MNKKAKLSVVLATFNEEKNITACLKPVKEIADEIIVIDGSSTDQTREIARKLGAKVFKTTNKPIFHINKNMAINKARGDWIYQLDADEVTTKELAKEIRKVVDDNYLGFEDWQSKKPWSNQEAPVAFWIKRKNFFLGRGLKKSGQYPDPAIRLFKKGKAHLPAKDVHEFMNVDGPVAFLQYDMNHHASPTFSRYLQRENRYSSLEAQLAKEQGVKPSLSNFISYMAIRPVVTFFTIFVRTKGFVDGFPGFIFALFSGIHHQLTYMKLWELTTQKRDLQIDKDWN